MSDRISDYAPAYALMIVLAGLAVVAAGLWLLFR